MAELTISVQTESADTVLSLAGEVDLGTVPKLRRAIRAALAAGPKAVAVDLAGVTFCDSSGLSVLVSGRKEAEIRDIDYRVINPSGMVTSVLTVTGLLDYLNVAESNGSPAIHG